MLIPQKFFTASTNSKQSKTCGIEAGHSARDIFALSVTAVPLTHILERRLKMAKYTTDRIDQVCEDLVDHTNWSWGDPMTDDIAHIILIHKEPLQEEEDEPS